MRNYIPSLNGLRALSISIVIASHIIKPNDVGAIQIPFPFSILIDGNFGVNVFFVISGFLITTLLMAEEDKTGTISLKNFYIRRIFRIFPAYYFVLLVYFILQSFSIMSFTTQSWLSSIFYYKYFVKGNIEMDHFWSLSMEEHFYLIWPLVFLTFKKYRVYFAFGVILLVCVGRVYAYSSGMNVWNITPLRIDAIMIGCLFAIYHERIRSWLAAHFNYKYLLLLLLVLFINSRYFEELNRLHRLHLGFLLTPLGVGVSVGTLTNSLIGMLLIFSIHYKNWWFSFLNAPAMNYIGKLSYSLYLWQHLFTMSTRVGVLSTFPINLCCIMAAALFSYYLIETPFLRLKSRFESRSAPKLAVALSDSALTDTALTDR
jgi:peptidoglycan/LPS O-acetylase OafA/YrhL